MVHVVFVRLVDMIRFPPLLGVFLLFTELGKPGTIAFSNSICNNLRKSIMFLDCQSRKSRVAASSTRLYLDSAKANSYVPIEDAYRTAQEFDEEWYTTVLSDILGVEELDNNEKNANTEKLPSADIDWDERRGNDNSKEAPLRTKNAADFVSSLVEEDGFRCFGEGKVPSDEIEQHGKKSDYLSTSSADNDKTPQHFKVHKEGRCVESRDQEQADREEILLDLGYSVAETRRLGSFAVEKIVQSGLQRPKEGIPKRWIEQSDTSETDMRHGFSDESNSIARIRKEETRKGNPSNAGKRKLMNPSKNGRRRRESQHRNRRKGGFSQASSGGSFKNIRSDEFWMDTETFSSFLRKEAQFRLSILGPGWSEAVKGESQWRLQIYKKWLAVLNETETKKSNREAQRVRYERRSRTRQKVKGRKERRQRRKTE